MKIFPENKENDSILEKQVKISLSVSLKHIILVLLLLSAFLLGRYIFPTENGIVISNISLFSRGAAQVQEEERVTELQVLTGTQSNTTANTTKANTTLSKGVQVNTTTKAATVNTSAAEKNSATITNSYKNIKLEFTQPPLFSWKGNLGKIKTVYYKITNNEAGTILPADIVVSLEGYETTQTTIHLPSIDTIITAGETKAH